VVACPMVGLLRPFIGMEAEYSTLTHHLSTQTVCVLSRSRAQICAMHAVWHDAKCALKLLPN